MNSPRSKAVFQGYFEYFRRFRLGNKTSKILTNGTSHPNSQGKNLNANIKMNLIFYKTIRSLGKANYYILIFFFFALFSSCIQKKNETTETITPPNLIFIMVDDMGYGDLGCFGQTEILTPNIDKLAGESMVFTQFYSGSPVCAPARSVLMTGHHTGHTTVRGNFGQGGVVGLCGQPGRIPLNAEDVTIAQVLKSKGYTTGMTGKWGLGEPNTTGLPNDKGFDEWFGFLNQARAHRQYPEYIWLNREKYDIPANLDGNKGQYVHHLFTDFALRFIEKHANEPSPFFLYLPYTLPHSDLEIDVMHQPYEEKNWTEAEKAYASMISLIDSDVAKILQLLDDKNIRENTLIMFTTDNGAANRYDGVFNSSGILKGAKRDVYEGGIRVPLIANMPGVITAGVNEGFVGYFTDILPTFASLAGAEIPDGLDWIDFSNVLLKDTHIPDTRVLYWEFHEKNGSQAVRKGKWKAVRLDVHEMGFHDQVELYDLDEDPGEANNLAAEYPEILEEMMRIMRDQRKYSATYPFQFEVAQSGN